MRQAGVNLVTVGIFSWVAHAARRGRVRLRLARTRMDLLHTAGIAVDLATATASPPPGFPKAYPTILPVDPRGDPLGARPPRRATAPVVRRYAEPRRGCRERLAERYARPSGAGHVARSNEYGCHNAQCYCEIGGAAFRDWLRQRYGDVGALNAAWGTAFWGQHYGRLEEVQPPRVAPVAQPDGPAARLRAVLLATPTSPLPRASATCCAASADVPVTTNFMMANCRPMDYWRWAAEVDVVVQRPLPATPREPDSHIELALAADLTRSRGGRQAVVAHGALDQRGQLAAAQPRQAARRDAPQQPRPRRPRRGRGAVLPVAGLRAGAEKFHSAMLPHAGTGSRTLARRRRARRPTLRPLAGSVAPASTAEVAIVWDWESYWALELEWRPTADLTSASGWTPSTRRSGGSTSPSTSSTLPPIFRDTGWLSRRAPYLLTEASAKNLHRYVEAGGHLVVSYFSGIVDEHDTIHPGAYPGALRELLGLSVEEFHPLREDETVTLATVGVTGPDLVRAGPPRGRARPCRHFTDGPDAGHPAVTANAFGGARRATWPPRSAATTCATCWARCSTARACPGRSTCPTPWSWYGAAGLRLPDQPRRRAGDGRPA